MTTELECIGEIIGLRHTPDGTREFWGYFSDDVAPRSQKVRVADHDAAAAEIARLQAQLAESRQQTEALFNTGMQYCDKIDALKAQVDALAGALYHATKLNSFREFNDYIPTMRAALAASGR